MWHVCHWMPRATNIYLCHIVQPRVKSLIKHFSVIQINRLELTAHLHFQPPACVAPSAGWLIYLELSCPTSGQRRQNLHLASPGCYSVRNWSFSKHNWASPQSKANLLTVRLRTHATSNVDTAVDDLSPPPPAAGASPGSHVLLVGQQN